MNQSEMALITILLLALAGLFNELEKILTKKKPDYSAGAWTKDKNGVWIRYKQ